MSESAHTGSVFVGDKVGCAGHLVTFPLCPLRSPTLTVARQQAVRVQSSRFQQCRSSCGSPEHAVEPAGAPCAVMCSSHFGC
jgi:hypothetical protein